uniref:non-specific serine/threonine protein kinase n=1 Tax=Anabas testudineus TaxID=64144 RepID=A0A7N6BE84_ANATE
MVLCWIALKKTCNLHTRQEQRLRQTLTDVSTEPLPNTSKSLSQEKSTDSDCLKPPSSSCNMPECVSHCLKDSDFRVPGCSGSSVPLLPHLSRDLISPTYKCFSEIYTKHESCLSFSLIQDSTKPQPSGAKASVMKGLMESSITDLLSSQSFSSQHCQATFQLQPLSPQSDSLESDTATAPVSDLYIFESETQDFILSPNVSPHKIKCPEYQPLSQTGEKEAGDSDTHVVMCDSAQYHLGSTQERTMMDDESDIQDTSLRPPAVVTCEVGLMLVNDATQAESTGLSPQPWRSDSPTEVWQDACQYLAGDDAKDRDVLVKTVHSVIQGGLSATSDLSFLPGETQVSGSNPEVNDWIGWSSDEARGPPVERWPSVDSWASALSDWTGIITAPPEDITAAFAEIGAEIDALTQTLADVNTLAEPEVHSQEPVVKTQAQPSMIFQDHPLEAQNIPASSGLSGQSCLSLCFEAAAPEFQGKERSKSVDSLCDSTPTTQGDKEPEETHSSQAESSLCSTHQHSPMGSSDTTVTSADRHSVDVTAVTLFPGSASSGNLDISHFDGYVESLDTDIFITNDGDPIILNIIEDTDLEGQNAPAEPFGDGFYEVTGGHRDSQQGFVAEQETQRSRGPAEVDVGGNESSPDFHLLTKDTLKNIHVPGEDTQPALPINVSADTSPDLDGACQVEPQSGGPKFITPIAPLSIGLSPVCQTSSSLEGDQTCAKRSLNDNSGLRCDHVQPCVLWPSSDGITDKASLEGDEELIHKEENIIESSPEEQYKHNANINNCFTNRKTIIEEIHDLSRELSNLVVVPADHFIISEEKRVAYITLDLNDPFVSRATKPTTADIQSEKPELNQETNEKMPHKTHKNTSESKTRSKKDKVGGHHHGAQLSKKQECPHVSAQQQTCYKQEAHPYTAENLKSENIQAGLEGREAKSVIDGEVATEKTPSKPHVKKKKKHGQSTTAVRSVPPVEVESGAKPSGAKGRIDMFEAKLGAKPGKAEKDSNQTDEKKSQQPEDKAATGQQPPEHTDHKGSQPKNGTSPLNDDAIKRRRLSGDKFGKIVSVLESKLPKADVPVKAKGEEPKLEAGANRKKAYSEVVKQKIPPKEELKVLQPIQAVSVSGDPQSLCLWCQFGAVLSDCTVTWSREGRVLAEIKRSAGDESRVSLTVSNASHKDLGKYQCQLTSLHGSVTLDYLLTYEVLSEIVIPPSPKNISSALVQVGNEEEDVHCSRLMFKDDFLSDKCFGENHPVSIITEKAHFGEGMHRRAFRTKLQAGQIPLLVPGHSCVLKVHNSISYGTKNNDELVQKNFSLAVEECQVQSTAREYIKEYTAVAQSIEAYGESPRVSDMFNKL